MVALSMTLTASFKVTLQFEGEYLATVHATVVVAVELE